MSIHPTAVVDPTVTIGARAVIHAYVVIRGRTELGDDVVIHPGAVIGGDPQDLRFDRSRTSGVRIGPRTVIREGVTVNRATADGGFTTVGADCFLMATSHVAHDCRVADRVIVANAVLLGGHVSIGERAFLGGAAVFHQHSRVGNDAMIGGGARISQDVPPFCLVAERNRLSGLNLVGLRRRGLSSATLREIKAAFRLMNQSAGKPRDVAAAALARGELTCPEARQFLEFFLAGHRSVVRTRRGQTPSRSGVDDQD